MTLSIIFLTLYSFKIWLNLYRHVKGMPMGTNWALLARDCSAML